MKNFLQFILTMTVLAFTLTSSFASNGPLTLLNNTNVEVYTEGNSAFITSVEYKETTENLSFNTTKNISIIQIYALDGKMLFQLPVMANKVKIHKDLFGNEGTFNLGFILDGEKQIQFTKVVLK